MPSKAAIIATSAAVAVLLVGGGVATAIALSGNREPDRSHSLLTAKGLIALSRDVHYSTTPGGCYADTTAQPDLQAGSTITIRDAAGTIVASGPLGAGAISPGNNAVCEFPFRISGVPTGSKFFTLTIGNSAPATVSADDLFAFAILNR